MYSTTHATASMGYPERSIVESWNEISMIPAQCINTCSQLGVDLARAKQLTSKASIPASRRGDLEETIILCACQLRFLQTIVKSEYLPML